MTIEEACLILNITDKSQLNKDYIMARYNSSYDATKAVSPFVADRIEGAKETLMEELNLNQ